MNQFKTAAVLGFLICVVGCGSESASEPTTEPTKGHEPVNASTEPDQSDLYQAFAVALDNSWTGGCDIEATADYYRKQTSLNWQRVDLNGDGQDEAICFGIYAVYPHEDGQRFIGGATGNAPGYAFQKRDGKWVQIAELSGVSHEIHKDKLNGWSVLSYSWKISKREYPTHVLAYEDGAYKPIYRYTVEPTDNY